jgi:cell division protein FtsQ
MSQQQRAYQDLTQGRPLFSETSSLPVSESGQPGRTRRVAHRRDTSVTRKRLVLNRKRPHYPRLFLGIASSILVVEIGAALLFSPRLRVQSIAVTGNQAVPAAQILALANPLKGQNLLRFPAGKLRLAILRDPTLEKVEVSRIWPSSIHIRVRERQPWANVQTPDQQWYTIDSKLVPFRKSAVPAAGLPRLTLAIAPVNGKLPTVVLGQKMTAPGLSEVSQCLEWAKARPDFPMESVSIDPTGKLCFNRVGGTRVLLGSATDLPRKLRSLGLLMQRYPIVDAAYINLFAYDAPAVMPKNAVTTASARTHSSKSSSPSHHRLENETADKPSEQP